MRGVIVAILLFAGCAHRPADTFMHILPHTFSAPWIDRDLSYWTASYSSYATNHFYVGATELHNGQLGNGLVFWKEERTIIFVGEPSSIATECMTWGHALKLGRDTVDTPDDLHGSTYLETHRTWVTWMEECIARGRLYTVSLAEAQKSYPALNKRKAHADGGADKALTINGAVNGGTALWFHVGDSWPAVTDPDR
jgi:hypothetical protein